MIQTAPRYRRVGQRRIDPKIDKLELEMPKYSPMKIETPWVLYLIHCTHWRARKQKISSLCIKKLGLKQPYARNCKRLKY